MTENPLWAQVSKKMDSLAERLDNQIDLEFKRPSKSTVAFIQEARQMLVVILFNCEQHQFFSKITKKSSKRASEQDRKGQLRNKNAYLKDLLATADQLFDLLNQLSEHEMLFLAMAYLNKSSVGDPVQTKIECLLSALKSFQEEICCLKQVRFRYKRGRPGSDDALELACAVAHIFVSFEQKISVSSNSTFVKVLNACLQIVCSDVIDAEGLAKRFKAVAHKQGGLIPPAPRLITLSTSTSKL